MNNKLLHIAVGKMLQQDQWEEIYNPTHLFDVNQYDYNTKQDYLNALRKKWQWHLDPWQEFAQQVNVMDYDQYEEYAEALKAYQEDIKETWKKLHDPNDHFTTNPHDFISEMNYLKALQTQWKEEYDYFDEFPSVVPNDYDTSEEYQEALLEAKQELLYEEWKADYDPDDNFFSGPSDFTSEIDYLNALRKEWKEEYDHLNECPVIDPDDFTYVSDYQETVEKAKKHISLIEDYPNFFFLIDPYDYPTQQDYLNALSLEAKNRCEKYHLFHDLHREDFEFSCDYIETIDALKQEWQKQHDPDKLFSVDPVDFNNEHDYISELHDAWKEKYDYFDEFPSIDPNNYDTHEDYHAALQETQKH